MHTFYRVAVETDQYSIEIMLAVSNIKSMQVMVVEAEGLEPDEYLIVFNLIEPVTYAEENFDHNHYRVIGRLEEGVTESFIVREYSS